MKIEIKNNFWKKLGLVFNLKGNIDWCESHATCPTPIQLPNANWRVFFSSRDKLNRSHVGWFEVNLDDPGRIINVAQKPILKPGPIGNFDGNGIYTTSIIKLYNGNVRFYTIGWNPGHVHPLFYASIGCAESEDMGLTISNRSIAPILDRSIYDPTGVTGPCVLLENGLYKMWYVSGMNWIKNKEELKSIYNIKYAVSNDGIDWQREGVVAIDFVSKDELNIARPCVLKNNQGYEAWFSYGEGKGYKIGYGVSKTGLLFNRQIKCPPVISTSQNYYEDKAVCHPAVVIHKGKKFMFYNGNSFGIDGVALAEESS